MNHWTKLPESREFDFCKFANFPSNCMTVNDSETFSNVFFSYSENIDGFSMSIVFYEYKSIVDILTVLSTTSTSITCEHIKFSLFSRLTLYMEHQFLFYEIVGKVSILCRFGRAFMCFENVYIIQRLEHFQWLRPSLSHTHTRAVVCFKPFNVSLCFHLIFM